MPKKNYSENNRGTLPIFLDCTKYLSLINHALKFERAHFCNFVCFVDLGKTHKSRKMHPECACTDRNCQPNLFVT